ncbi:MAG: DUF4115 domain-containing protein [Burkholderiaceae bacterium]|nr:DUF4115 domain-containing protein [Burkholderiaceae bacterium]
MNVEASTPPQSITQIASPEQLVAAREARGWSMSDVAAKLGMMPRQIDAIEHGRWEALPGAAFVRGAIRAYGKALQLDVAPLLSTLGAQSGAPELRPSSSLDSPLPRHGALGFDNGGSGSRIVWIVLGVIGVIAIAMYFGRGADFGQVLEPGSGGSAPGRSVDVMPVAPGASSAGGARDATRADSSDSTRAPSPGADASVASTGAGSTAPASSTTPAASTATQPAPAAAPGGNAPASAPGGNAASDNAAPGSTGAAGAVAAPAAAASDASTSTSANGASSAAAAPASAPAPSEAAPPVAADSVVLRFERESWVDVRDASGKVLLMGTQPANSTREVSGQKPYSLTIGNATFVRVEHGGRNVDLGAVTQKGVARVRVE